jgi:hypothetical protein
MDSTHRVNMLLPLPDSLQFGQRPAFGIALIIRGIKKSTKHLLHGTQARAGSPLEEAAVEAKIVRTGSRFFDHACDKVIVYIRLCKDADGPSSSCRCYPIVGRSR